MIYCMHGFLGQPTDWNAFEGAWKDGVGKPYSLRPQNLWEQLPSSPGQEAFQWWAGHLERTVRRDFESIESLPLAQKPVLMGYSMGGRLALHSLIRSPDLWRAAVIISANPGLKTERERRMRLLHDQSWASRFREEPWHQIRSAWNLQGVFRQQEKEIVDLSREEAEFDRAQLVRSLDAWSLGRQADLRPALNSVRVPVLWVVGENDEKFVNVARDLMKDLEGGRHKIELKIVEGAAHRVPWEQPDRFRAAVQTFLGM